MRVSINIGESDHEIAAYLSKQENKQRFIRDLIRDHMKEEEKKNAALIASGQAAAIAEWEKKMKGR